MDNRRAKAKRSKKDNYLVQGSILAAAGIIVRFIGLLYKIPMTRILGDEGIGYYNTAYEIYNIGLILSSYSLPLAVSKLVAQTQAVRQLENSRRVYRCGLVFGLAAGGIMSLILLLGADFIAANIFNSPASALPLKVMAPTILVFSVMGVMRGYFQGLGNMIPTSVSQVIEQVVNAGVSIGASYLFMKKFADAEAPGSYGAAGGTLGTLLGAVAAFLFLSLIMGCFRYTRKRMRRRGSEGESAPYPQVAMVLFLTVVPIILSQAVYQLSGSVDNSMFGIIMGGKGLDEKARLSLLGIYSGKYRLLSNVPVAIATSLGASMIPSIVVSKSQKRHQEVCNKVYMTIKFNMLLAIPCAVGMGVLAGPIMRMVFGDDRQMTANLMMMGAVAVIFFSLSTVTNAVLQGIDLMRKSVLHSAAALVIHAGLVYLMLQHIDLSVYGLVIGNVTFALTVCILNWIAIGRALRYRQEIRTTFLLPLAASVVMGIAALGCYWVFYLLLHSNGLALLIAVPAAMAVYGAGIIWMGAVDEDELLEMPMGARLLRLCRRIHLM